MSVRPRSSGKPRGKAPTIGGPWTAVVGGYVHSITGEPYVGSDRTAWVPALPTWLAQICQDVLSYCTAQASSPDYSTVARCVPYGGKVPVLVASYVACLAHV